jgi:iron complex outermembrane receptor protein
MTIENKQKRQALLLTGVAVLTVGWTSAASAQSVEPPAQAPAPQADPDDNDSLGDIIVTAQKREQRLQDVPIAVTALQGDMLQQQNVQSTRDLQFVVPSLVFNQLSSYGQPFLRGIGSDLVGPNAEAGVATYIDGVFVAAGAGIVQGLLGTDRVEVLAGPQGTLYGRNAVGGAINIYTLTPGATLEAAASGTYGRYDRTDVSAHVSGPVSDTLSLGVYGAFQRRGTYLDFSSATPDDANEVQAAGVRAKAVLKPSDMLTFTLSGEYVSTRNNEAGTYRNAQPDALAYAFGAPNLSGQRFLIDSDNVQFSNTEQWGAYLRTDLDLGWSQVLSITSYRDLKEDGFGDVDGTSAPILASFSPSQFANQFSQEIQLLAPSSSSVQWIIGAYYFDGSSGYKDQITEGVVFPAPVAALDNRTDIKTRSLAFFGQATVPIDRIAEGLKLTLGGRYTIDHKRYRASSLLFGASGAQIGPETFYPVDSKTWRKFTPKITLDYKIDRTLLYATYSRGFKAGAYNPSTPTSPGPVDPETLDAFEIGLKSTIANKVRLSTAGYYYKFSNIQVSRIDLGTSIIQNAAEGEAYGVEGSLFVAATSNLDLSASASLEHTEYKRFNNAVSYVPSPAGNASVPVDASGNRMIRAPKLVFNLGANQAIPLGNGGKINLAANYYYNDGFFWDAANQLRQGSYDLANASVEYVLPGDRFSVRGFVNNIGDTYYRTQSFYTPVSLLVQEAIGRTYGITLQFKY